MFWLTVLLILFCSVAYSSLANCYRYRQCVRLSARYEQWLKDQKVDIVLDKSQVLDLFARAGIKDTVLPCPQLRGPILLNGRLSIFENFHNPEPQVAGCYLNKFSEAIGFYKSHMYAALNPLIWVETFLFWPRSIIKGLGLDPEKAGIKAVSILLTGVWWVVGFFFAVFESNIKDFILHVLYPR